MLLIYKILKINDIIIRGEYKMKKLIKPAILSISLLIIMTGNTVSPVLGEIREAFPEANTSLIKMILTLPSFVIIPFSFISGKISTIFKKRNIIIIGLIIYIIAGLGGGLARNIYELLIFRGLIGASMGLIMPFTTSLIADFYEHTERTVMMGLSNATANLGGIIATLAAGILAIYNWRYIFLVYSIAIVILFLVIFKLPEPPKRANNDEKFSLNNKILLIAASAFFLNIVFYSVITNISLFLKNENIGNSGYSGIAMSFITLAGFLSSILLRQVSKVFKRIRVPFALSVMSLGFLQLSQSFNLTSVLISTFMIGFGLGILKPILFLKVAEFTPKHANAFAISIISNSILFGKFVSPFFINWWGKLFNNNTFRFIFLSMGISLVSAALISLLIILYYVKVLNPRY